MFCEEIRIKQGLSYISFCPLRILYNSKFILMETSLGTNAVVVIRVHCMENYAKVNRDILFSVRIPFTIDHLASSSLL